MFLFSSCVCASVLNNVLFFYALRKKRAAVATDITQILQYYIKIEIILKMIYNECPLIIRENSLGNDIRTLAYLSFCNN